MAPPSGLVRRLLAIVAVIALFGVGWLLGWRRPAPLEEIPLTASQPLAPAPGAPTARPNLLLTILPPSLTPPPTVTRVVQTVTVHVNGAVARPGVYTLAANSRIIDALAAAGGLLPTAADEIVNQAALLRDGQQVYVPTRGTPVPQGLVPAGQAAPASKGAAATVAPGGPINLNRATAEELDALPGIGPALSARIIEYREKVGPFQRPEDLKKVSGIGDKLFESLKERITAP